jgi:hypothetical protein
MRLVLGLLYIYIKALTYNIVVNVLYHSSITIVFMGKLSESLGHKV